MQYLFVDVNYLPSLRINKKCISFNLFCVLLNCMPKVIFSKDCSPSLSAEMKALVQIFLHKNQFYKHITK